MHINLGTNLQFLIFHIFYKIIEMPCHVTVDLLYLYLKLLCRTKKCMYSNRLNILIHLRKYDK